MLMSAKGQRTGVERPGRVTIRFARSAEDIAARVEMGRWAWKEIDDGLPYDEEVSRRAFERALGREDRCLIQAELDGRLIGGLSGAAGPHFHSPAIGAYLITWYVLPAHRRRPLVAVKLLHEFRRWAVERGAVRMYVGISSGLELARTDKLMKHLGFRFRGGNYMAAL